MTCVAILVLYLILVGLLPCFWFLPFVGLSGNQTCILDINGSCSLIFQFSMQLLDGKSYAPIASHGIRSNGLRSRCGRCGWHVDPLSPGSTGRNSWNLFETLCFFSAFSHDLSNNFSHFVGFLVEFFRFQRPIAWALKVIPI